MATSDKLKIADLKDTKSALWGARTKWEDIGRCIGVDETTLDTLRGKSHGDSLNGVLSHWLRGVHKPGVKNSKPRTWRTLIDALQDEVVDEEVMADELEKEKYPGTTPKAKRSAPADVSSATRTDLTFSSSMSDEDFLKWLRVKGVNDKDCKTLSESGITASGFLQFDAEDFDDIGLTKLGKKRILKTFTEVKEGGEGKAKRKDEPPVNDETQLGDGDLSSINTKLVPYAAKWRDIGEGLGFKEGEMDNIENKPKLLNDAPKSYLREMLKQWLQWAPGDGRGSTGFATRELLRAALLHAGLGRLAQEFQ